VVFAPFDCDEDALFESELQYRIELECARANEQAANNSLYLVVSLGFALGVSTLDEWGHLNPSFEERIREIVANHNGVCARR
jgi:hypothetical protein